MQPHFDAILMRLDNRVVFDNPRNRTIAIDRVITPILEIAMADVSTSSHDV
jgi:hypothetical protein